MTTRYAKSNKRKHRYKNTYNPSSRSPYINSFPPHTYYNFNNAHLLQTHPKIKLNNAVSTSRTHPHSRLLLILIMAFTMPSFLSRFTRPFTSSTRLSLNPTESAAASEADAAVATVAAGCFWGVEHMFRKEFKGKGLYDAKVGYIGGDTKHPDYQGVCSGKSGRKLPPSAALPPKRSKTITDSQ
jgi:hypothetical protein